MRILLMLIAIISISNSDNLKEEIINCSKNEGELLRLYCYDNIIKENNFKIKTEEIEKKSFYSWILTVDKPKNSILMSLISSDGYAKNGKPVSLFISCVENTTKVVINWESYFNEPIKVTTKIGNGVPIEEEWEVSNDSKFTIHKNKTISLLRNMSKEKKVLFEIKPVNEKPIVAIFNIDGIKAPLKTLADSCGWKLN